MPEDEAGNTSKPSNFATLGTARTNLTGVGDATLDTIHRLHRSSKQPQVFIRHSAREYGKAFNDLDNPLSNARACARTLARPADTLVRSNRDLDQPFGPMCGDSRADCRKLSYGGKRQSDP